MEWIPNDAFGGIKNTGAEAEGQDSDIESSAIVDGEDKGGAAEEPMGVTADVDMDVAEDEDQWL